jgi:hypothetical protein
MLKPQDIEIEVGRAAGGDFMKIVHRPTGISRSVGPPLPTPGKSRQQMIREIEAELIERGLTQHLLPNKEEAQRFRE